MRDVLFHLQRKSGMTLQTSIREMVMEALLQGLLAEGESLPSCRELAQRLKVSRNTVAQAYQGLCEDGIIASISRSGFFVNRDLGNNPLWQSLSESNLTTPQPQSSWMMKYIKEPPSRLQFISKPRDWHTYEYPFVFGQVDRELFPINAWRECSRQAMSVKNLEMWTGDALNYDDPQLVHYIKSRLLPRRGIGVNDDNILITLGAQNALYLIASLLASDTISVGMENPGYPDARYQFQSFNHNIIPLPLDEQGLRIDGEAQQCQIIYTTPSYQYPSNITMSMQRRQELLSLAKTKNIIIIEDDYECENNFQHHPYPSLKALDKNNNVIYIGSLSKNLFPAIRIGYIVASTDVINELRSLRRLVIRHAPMNNQRTAALFLGLGYHQSFINKLQKTLHKRRTIIIQALQNSMSKYIQNTQIGLSGLWGQFNQNINSKKLAENALKKGIIIEVGDIFFADKKPPQNFFRLGFSSIPEQKITQGIELLAQTCEEIIQNQDQDSGQNNE